MCEKTLALRAFARKCSHLQPKPASVSQRRSSTLGESSLTLRLRSKQFLANIKLCSVCSSSSVARLHSCRSHISTRTDTPTFDLNCVVCYAVKCATPHTLSLYVCLGWYRTYISKPPVDIQFRILSLSSVVRSLVCDSKCLFRADTYRVCPKLAHSWTTFVRISIKSLQHTVSAVIINKCTLPFCTTHNNRMCDAFLPFFSHTESNYSSIFVGVNRQSAVCVCSAIQ